jgi:hypothetical protein
MEVKRISDFTHMCTMDEISWVAAQLDTPSRGFRLQSFGQLDAWFKCSKAQLLAKSDIDMIHQVPRDHIDYIGVQYSVLSGPAILGLCACARLPGPEVSLEMTPR